MKRRKAVELEPGGPLGQPLRRKIASLDSTSIDQLYGLEPVYEPGSYLIWRRELQIYFRPLGEEEASVVAAAREGHSFGELCVLLCEHLDESEAALHAAGFLRGWVQSGLIVNKREVTQCLRKSATTCWR